MTIDKAAAALARWVRRRRQYRAVFVDHPAGREVFADLCGRYHILGVATVAGDPVSSAFRDGQRSVIAEIGRMTRMTEEEVIKMAVAARRGPEAEENDDE